MRLNLDSQLWFVDTKNPHIGEITLQSIYQGCAECGLYGQTGHQTGDCVLFTDKDEALKFFHEIWRRAEVEEWYNRIYGDLKDIYLQELYSEKMNG